MQNKTHETRLQNGTMIRHKVAGYKGWIDGTTEIRACFTARGELLGKSSHGETFQYRVAIAGESMRRIAPAEDLEVLETAGTIVCPSCHASFQSKPGAAGKPGGRCQCGGWICPNCLSCQEMTLGPDEDAQSRCLNQRKRLLRKATAQKRRIAGDVS